MKVSNTHLIARKGVAQVQQVFYEELKWEFREQPTSNFGIDAHVETVVDGHATGRLLAVQIKNGASYFREEGPAGYVFRGDAEHLEYWLTHSLPVILVLCDTSVHVCVWESLSESSITRTGKGWRLEIPRSNRLGRRTESRLRELADGPRPLQHLREIERVTPWKTKLKHLPVSHPPVASLVGTQAALLARTASGLEVSANLDPDLNYVSLLAAFSTPDPEQAADLAVLTAWLSEVEIINHDDQPTEVLRLWLTIAAEGDVGDIPPPEIKEENLRGTLRIGARSRQKYDLGFTAVFEGALQNDWRSRVRLCLKTIGLGDLRIPLSGTFFG